VSIWLGVVRRQWALDHNPEVIEAKRALDNGRAVYDLALAFEKDKRALRKAKKEFQALEATYSRLIGDAKYGRK
jgi:hypothetical protein